jgi:hypothetical protein
MANRYPYMSVKVLLNRDCHTTLLLRRERQTRRMAGSMTQAIPYLRGAGLAQTDEEGVAEDDDRVRQRPLYPC